MKHRTRNVDPSSPERRVSVNRRRRLWWSMWYGSLHPRRRRPPRRDDETRFSPPDLHEPHLFAVAMGIVLLSVADAFMTVTLLSNGAIEANPLMAAVIYKSAALFASIKMTLTGIGVIIMVLLARYRFMRMVRVQFVLYAVLVGYLSLLTYEYLMLRGAGDFPTL